MADLRACRYDTLHEACTNLTAGFRKMEVLMRAAVAERYISTRRRLPAKMIKHSSRWGRIQASFAGPSSVSSQKPQRAGPTAAHVATWHC